GGVNFHCNGCHKDITHIVRICCAVCADTHICVECFSAGAEFHSHLNTHPYRVFDTLQTTIYTEDWSAEEEWFLLEGIETMGMGNWQGISEVVGTKTREECEKHYFDIYVTSDEFPLPKNVSNDRELSMEAKILTKDGLEWLGKEKFEKAINSYPEIPKLTSVPANHEIQGYMPLRGEFDYEQEQEAEMSVKDISFHEDDSASEVELKLTMLEIYYDRLNRRYEKRDFVLTRGFTDYKKMQTIEKSRSKEERDILNTMKPFARFMTPGDFNDFCSGLFAEKELMNRCALLQECRKMGFTTLAQVEAYEKEKILSKDPNYKRKEPSVSPYVKPPKLVIRASGSTDVGSIADFLSGAKGGRMFGNEDALISIGTPLDMNNTDGAELLSPKERELCGMLRLNPKSYLNVKDTLMAEYHKQGHLKRAKARQMIKIDVNKTGKLYDFFVKCGWIKNQFPPSVQN
ncbi:hypothetical protein ROZALSC1DRAFT_31414, partial [Rozella allomycis CSF55]